MRLAPNFFSLLHIYVKVEYMNDTTDQVIEFFIESSIAIAAFLVAYFAYKLQKKDEIRDIRKHASNIYYFLSDLIMRFSKEKMQFSDF